MGFGGQAEGLRQNGKSVYGFFGVTGDHVDRSKPPGSSRLTTPTLGAWFFEMFTGRIIYNSPNLVWLGIALWMYVFFPYNLDPRTSAAALGPLSMAFFRERLPLWLGVVFAYYGFWEVAEPLWCSRSLVQGRGFRWGRFLHNVMYCVAGIVIFVGFENVMCHLWATGKHGYLSDKDAFNGSWGNFAVFVLGLLLVPQWRDMHFYFAHRLLHFRPTYSFVHSLHHRNTDVTPLAGLCMHPVEHLYYYASVLPSVVLPLLSPSSFLFNAVHFMLAPAAGHTTWEDHWQADVYHFFRKKW